MEIVVKVILIALTIGIYLAIAKWWWNAGKGNERFVFALWIIVGIPISMQLALIIMLLVVHLLLPIGILISKW